MRPPGGRRSPWLGWSVAFAVPAEVAFDYLADPANRPQWQSSLRRVELLDEGPPHVGQRWRDVTAVPGVVPEMRTSALERPTLWVEEGHWRSVAATGALRLEPTPTGCVVRVAARLRVPGLLAPLGPLLTVAAGVAVVPDLRRAARVLADRDDAS
ncbi:MAG TPA: SRPBCC family protein [Marmoricola sp.]|jgi:uncharacterized membrane protein|nr:SRPBCC family protein [Marmoricola sp.]